MLNLYFVQNVLNLFSVRLSYDKLANSNQSERQKDKRQEYKKKV